MPKDPIDELLVAGGAADRQSGRIHHRAQNVLDQSRAVAAARRIEGPSGR